jgi:hypothetical protein
MRRITLLVLVLVALTSGRAVAAPITYIAYLNGPSEAPPNASPGTGTALVTIDAVAHTMSVNANFEDLIGLTTASHIHVINGPGDANLADTAGPVATTTPSFVGFPLGVSAGTFDNTLNMTLASSYRGGFISDSGGTTATAEAALFAAIAEGRAYFNIHTNIFGGGEIRGFLQPVPEPAALLIFSIGAAAVLRRSRQASRRAAPRLKRWRDLPS